jgi:hypothetical protein
LRFYERFSWDDCAASVGIYVTSPRQVVRNLGCFTTAFLLVGLAVGLWAMVERVVPIAESGRKPTDMLSYAFWVPLCLIVGGIIGQALDAVFRRVRDFLR